ncbi:MAG: 2TM domain-containing protein [Promethearchaeota archaeon]
MSEGNINEFNDDSVKKIAREIIIMRYVVLLHIWIYFIVNLVLFIINLLTYSKYPWILWSLSGWGLVLASHLFVYWIYRKGFERGAKIGILYHSFYYILINFFLIFVALFTSEPRWSIPKSFWFLWPICGWGFGLMIHLIVYFYFSPRKGESHGKRWIDRQIDKELYLLHQEQNIPVKPNIEKKRIISFTKKNRDKIKKRREKGYKYLKK